jgi:hypothetical protein
MKDTILLRLLGFLKSELTLHPELLNKNKTYRIQVGRRFKEGILKEYKDIKFLEDGKIQIFSFII